MKTLSDDELSRQYRLLGQRIEMHSILATRYQRYSTVAEVTMLLGSAVFAVTVFGSDNFFSALGIDEKSGENALRLTSIAVFSASLILLVLDWSGKAARHRQALGSLSKTLEAFREAGVSDHPVDSSTRKVLSAQYWRSQDTIEPIPPSKFVSLKAKYLIKKEMSILTSSYPACPRWILRLKLVGRDTYRAARDQARLDYEDEERNS